MQDEKPATTTFRAHLTETGQSVRAFAFEHGQSGCLEALYWLYEPGTQAKPVKMIRFELLRVIYAATGIRPGILIDDVMREMGMMGEREHGKAA